MSSCALLVLCLDSRLVARRYIPQGRSENVVEIGFTSRIGAAGGQYRLCWCPFGHAASPTGSGAHGGSTSDGYGQGSAGANCGTPNPRNQLQFESVEARRDSLTGGQTT